jgi:hypothetical protein
VEAWLFTDALGREWGAIGVNRTQAAKWFSLQLYMIPAAGGETLLDRLPEQPTRLTLTQRPTQRLLQRLWFSSRLLLSGVSLAELLDRATGSPPDRTFRRQLSVLVRRAKRMSPAPREQAALLDYIQTHFVNSRDGASVQQLWPPAEADTSDSVALPPRDATGSARERLGELLRWFREYFPYDRGDCVCCGAAAEFYGTVRASVAERRCGFDWSGGCGWGGQRFGVRWGGGWGKEQVKGGEGDDDWCGLRLWVGHCRGGMSRGEGRHAQKRGGVNAPLFSAPLHLYPCSLSPCNSFSG